MCGGGGSKKPKPAVLSTVPNPENTTADNSNSTVQRQMVAANTTPTSSFGSDLSGTTSPTVGS